jgi:hypothetical protein
MQIVHHSATNVDPDRTKRQLSQLVVRLHDRIESTRAKIISLRGKGDDRDALSHSPREWQLWRTRLRIGLDNFDRDPRRKWGAWRNLSSRAPGGGRRPGTRALGFVGRGNYVIQCRPHSQQLCDEPGLSNTP